MGGAIVGEILGAVTGALNILSGAFNVLNSVVGIVSSTINLFAATLNLTVKGLQFLTEILYISWEIFSELLFVLTDVVEMFISFGSTVTSTTGIVNEQSQTVEEHQGILASLFKTTVIAVTALGA